MGFASGSVSFRRFSVIGQVPTALDQSLLDKLKEAAFKSQELGMPEETEYGWCGGSNVFDNEFSFANNVYADCLVFGLRIDTKKVPGNIRAAYRQNEERVLAAGDPSGFISKIQRRDARETAKQRVEQEMREGKHRRSRMIAVLWDVTAQTLYASVTGKAFEILSEIFERTFGFTLHAITPSVQASRILSQRDYEDLRPTRFVPGPEGDSQYPEYPWVSKGPDPKAFLGNEFLVWLCHREQEEKDFDGIAVFVDRQLDMDCAYGQTGRDTFRGDGPSRAREAREAFRSGKVPRKLGMLLNAHKQDYSLTLSGDLTVTAAKLPTVEDAETPRVLFEERIASLRDLSDTLTNLFNQFMAVRGSSSRWNSRVDAVRKWLKA